MEEGVAEGVKMWSIGHQHSAGVRARRDRLYVSDLQKCFSCCHVHIHLIQLNVFVSFIELYFFHFHNWISLSWSCASGTGSAVWGWESERADSISQFPLSSIQKGKDKFLERKNKTRKTDKNWSVLKLSKLCRDWGLGWLSSTNSIAIVSWQYFRWIFLSENFFQSTFLLVSSVCRDGKTCRYCRYICAIFLGCANFLAVYAQTN